MPGQNILGRCSGVRDHSFPYTTLTIQIDFNGTLTQALTGTGGSDTTTVTSASFSLTLTYDRIDYDYGSPDSPPDGSDLWVLQEECCCPCKLKLGFNGEFDHISDSGVMPVDIDITDSGGTEHESFNSTFFYSLTLRAGVDTPDEFNSLPCRNGAENPRRNMIFLSLAPSAGAFAFQTFEPEDFTQDTDLDGADLIEDLQTILALEMIAKNDLCNGQNFTASSTWSASKTTPGIPSGSFDETYSGTITVDVALG